MTDPRTVEARRGVTDRQLVFLTLVADGVTRYRDLATALGARSTNTTSTYIRTLERRGYVVSSIRSASLRLTDLGLAAVGPCAHMANVNAARHVLGDADIVVRTTVIAALGRPTFCPWCARKLLPW